MQYADNSPLAEATLFGAGSFVAADGKTAADPGDRSRAGEKWFNDGVWKDHFIPNATADQQRSARQGQRVRRPATSRWTRPTRGSRAASTRPRRPSRPSRTSACAVAAGVQRQDHGQAPRRHVQHPQDHEAPGRGVRGPDRARRLARAARRRTARCRPIRPSSSRSSTPSTSSSRASSSTGPSRRRCCRTRTSPTTRPGCPTTPSPRRRWQAFQNKYRTTDGLDIDAELDTLKTTLQGIFDAALVAPPPHPPGRVPRPPGRRSIPYHCPSPSEPDTVMTESTEALPATTPLRPGCRAGSASRASARRSGASSSSARGSSGSCCSPPGR